MYIGLQDKKDYYTYECRTTDTRTPFTKQPFEVL